MSLIDMSDRGVENLLKAQNRILENLGRTLKSMDEKLEIVVGCINDGPVTDEQEDSIRMLRALLSELDPTSILVNASSANSYKTAHHYITRLQRAIRWSYNEQDNKEEE